MFKSRKQQKGFFGSNNNPEMPPLQGNHSHSKLIKSKHGNFTIHYNKNPNWKRPELGDDGQSNNSNPNIKVENGVTYGWNHQHSVWIPVS